MKFTKKITLALSLAAIFYSLGTSALMAAPASSKVLAVVNGETITEDGLKIYTSQRNVSPGTPPQSGKRILEEMINMVVLSQDARAQKLTERNDTREILQLQRNSYLASIAVQQHVSKNPVSDAELKDEYDQQVASASSSMEFNARHILLESEVAAKAVIAELDKGADFVELAKTKSTGPSGKSGGSLGWFGPQDMVPPFSQATAKLAKGSYSKAPVKTQFGWHVILLEDTRESKPPSFEEVRNQLKAMADNRRARDYISSLREKAKVEIK